MLASHFLYGLFSHCRQGIECGLCRIHSENSELDASDEGFSVCDGCEKSASYVWG